MPEIQVVRKWKRQKKTSVSKEMVVKRIKVILEVQKDQRWKEEEEMLP